MNGNAPRIEAMKYAFTKMQGAGNDFVVFDATSRPFDLTRAQLKAVADRHFGVGCDQVLVVEKAADSHADFRYRIFNADGGMSGSTPDAGWPSWPVSAVCC